MVGVDADFLQHEAIVGLHDARIGAAARGRAVVGGLRAGTVGVLGRLREVALEAGVPVEQGIRLAFFDHEHLSERLDGDAGIRTGHRVIPLTR